MTHLHNSESSKEFPSKAIIWHNQMQFQHNPIVWGSLGPHKVPHRIHGQAVHRVAQAIVFHIEVPGAVGLPKPEVTYVQIAGLGLEEAQQGASKKAGDNTKGRVFFLRFLGDLRRILGNFRWVLDGFRVFF